MMTSDHLFKWNDLCKWLKEFSKYAYTLIYNLKIKYLNSLKDPKNLTLEDQI